MIDAIFVKDKTNEDIEKVKGSNTHINDDLIDFEPISTIKDAIHGDVPKKAKTMRMLVS